LHGLQQFEPFALDVGRETEQADLIFADMGLDQQARDLAAAQKVALVDLTNLAWAYYQTLPDKTVLFVPGQETHFTESGATQIAAIVARALKQAVPSLAPSFK